MNGKIPQESVPVPCPAMLVHVWGMFLELHHARGGNGFGANPIAYGEIVAWMRLTGNCPSAFEVGAIKALDGVYLKSQAKVAGRGSDR